MFTLVAVARLYRCYDEDGDYEDKDDGDEDDEDEDDEDENDGEHAYLRLFTSE